MNKQEASAIGRRVEIHLTRGEFYEAIDIVRRAQEREQNTTIESLTYEQKLDLPIASIDSIPPRVVDTLDRRGILTVRDALAALHFAGIGPKGLESIQNALDDLITTEPP